MYHKVYALRNTLLPWSLSVFISECEQTSRMGKVFKNSPLGLLSVQWWTSLPTWILKINTKNVWFLNIIIIGIVYVKFNENFGSWNLSCLRTSKSSMSDGGTVGEQALVGLAQWAPFHCHLVCCCIGETLNKATWTTNLLSWILPMEVCIDNVFWCREIHGGKQYRTSQHRIDHIIYNPVGKWTRKED